MQCETFKKMTHDIRKYIMIITYSVNNENNMECVIQLEARRV